MGGLAFGGGFFLMSFVVGPQHGIHPRLIPPALALEPFEHIRIKANRDLFLRNFPEKSVSNRIRGACTKAIRNVARCDYTKLTS